VEAFIRNPIIPRDEIKVPLPQLLVLKIWHILDGHMSLLAMKYRRVDIPLCRLLVSRELGWTRDLKLFFFFKMPLASFLGTTRDTHMKIDAER
jgi:hypothetical protein